MENEIFVKAKKRDVIARRLSKILIYFLLALWAVAVLFPFYWMILTSIKEQTAYNSEVTPEFNEVSKGHFVACHHIDKVN